MSSPLFWFSNVRGFCLELPMDKVLPDIVTFQVKIEIRTRSNSMISKILM